jgi:hypothetical protein
MARGMAHRAWSLMNSEGDLRRAQSSRMRNLEKREVGEAKAE